MQASTKLQTLEALKPLNCIFVSIIYFFLLAKSTILWRRIKKTEALLRMEPLQYLLNGFQMKQVVANNERGEEKDVQWSCLGWLDGLADLMWGPEEEAGHENEDVVPLEQPPSPCCGSCCCCC